MIMTEKLYYKNPYQKVFSAHVLKCEKEKGNWQVVLDRTAFYPEGGGQPADIGVLDLANVTDVQVYGDEIVHTTDRPLNAGSAVMGGVNWEHRFRLMQQHTGEHIVSGIANRLYGVDNVGFHMGEKNMTVDWNGRLKNDQLRLIERLANEAVYSNLPVSAEFPPPEKLNDMNYRSKKELTGRIRIVTVPGYDMCACCGTHVAFTGEIGAIKLLTSQNYKGGTRVTLACGTQAMEDFELKQQNVMAVSSLLSAKPEEIADAVSHLVDDNERLKHELSETRGHLLEMKADAFEKGCGNISVFEKSFLPDDMRKYAIMLAKRGGGVAAVFCGADGGYRYAMAGSNNDVRPIGKKLDAEFSGRGGGSKELFQGSVKGKQSELEHFFQQLSSI
ncbi:MAG TPA: alanyl-tRNA editing protein [Ruminococcaceae bacterium]|nr:alanyl-tRNA editing protein [Oscillospiraceae bacterium]